MRPKSERPSRLAGEALDIDDFTAIDADPIAVSAICAVKRVFTSSEAAVVRCTCDICAFCGAFQAYALPVPTSPAHEVCGLAVYQKANGKPISLELVHRVINELSQHTEGCSCGYCSWCSKADPLKTFRAARRWQGTAARAKRLARLPTRLRGYQNH